ncbi:MAG: dihydropteroate synthase [Anaerolineae bacterium]|nr:dihydropteroate synthase [Anaerolineae bacterium]
MRSNTLRIGSTTFVWGRQTYVMGIINVTPDSFSGDGLMHGDNWIQQAVAQGRKFTQEGAHLLDVGGESTRPGAETIEVEEELKRVVPVIEALAAKVDVPISVDTYKAKVAAAALDAGAQMVNDVWGLRMDPNMADLCAKRKVPVVVMHNRSHPRNAVQEERLGGRYLGTTYDDLLADVANELQHSINLAKTAGIPDERIIIDPGIGFGKTVEQNLTLLKHLDKLTSLGYPILLGTSNKSMIGYTLDLPPDERVEGTAATVAIGIDRGADIIRVHQVREMSRVARMTDAIVRPARPG